MRGLGIPVLLLVAGALLAAGRAPAAARPSRFVDAFAGTAADAPDFGTGGGAGNTFPGAVVPFGMLAWSPDTTPARTNSPGGYDWEDTRIRGFGLTHLSGVGCPIFQDVPLLPTTVPITTSPATKSSYLVAPAYVPSFDHRRERAEPGYYRVVLDPGTPRAIRVELTATTRTGFGRFVYPRTAAASVLFNAGGSAMANGDVAVAIDPERREVSGWVESGQFCYHRNRYRLYFAARFDRPFARFGTWTKQALAPGTTAASDHADAPFHLRPLSGIPSPPASSNGAQAGAFVTFETRHDRVVQARVGISFVGVENARENLRVENPRWRFARVRRRARAAWDALLGRIRVRGGRREDLRTFYTMLYHALLGPTVFGDANGQYAGMDGQVHTAEGHTPYSTFSGWDVYRSQIALLAILVPERASDMVRSLLANARESGWLPRWTVANGHTDVMVGDPAAPIIAGAHAFGARAFDQAEALRAMVKGATEEGTSANADYVERQALADYLALGWVPHDGTETSSGGTTSMFGSTHAVWGSAATTLEYAVADFAIARYAAALGDAGTCAAFMQRAANWRHLVDPASGYLAPRYASGAFKAPFDPASLEGWAEGNGAQYTWMVPHDVAGLVAALGGPAAVAARLDAFFQRLNAGPTEPFAFLGNEPGAGTPWLYDWLARPDRTQDVVRRAVLELFAATPGGYPGNDDMGQMSSWYVFGALGLYPAVPGTDVLALGSPLFRRARLRLAGGTVTIVARAAARDRPYVRRLTVDGAEHARPWIRFRDIAGGARLVFDLASAPGDWGRRPEDAPPSFAPERAEACAAP